ncbi:hypothetical protein M422DRAFT_46804 [Sphaerobolus stellatus SS14]|uniref:Uncharacterized protein n=1 Tax=Sphaerobolus stellatus (strain SS14) TaxID=990650 RepID=A0A0C9VS90_SPHS4|nr:hypothetical protein M422DRAFT_46804 [Sphaerobolus stellatus SS14]
MAGCLFAPNDEDDASSSAFSYNTSDSSSTVWGPGALSGKALKAVGELGLDLLSSLVIRRRLSTIKRTFDESPSLFVQTDTPEVQQFEMDLQELRSERYSPSIRETAITLFIDICTLRKVFNRMRALWALNPRIFTAPQGSQEESLMAQSYVALYELSSPGYSTGIRKMALTVIHLIAEAETMLEWEKQGLEKISYTGTVKQKLGRWAVLENNVKGLRRAKGFRRATI